MSAASSAGLCHAGRLREACPDQVFPASRDQGAGSGSRPSAGSCSRPAIISHVVQPDLGMCQDLRPDFSPITQVLGHDSAWSATGSPSIVVRETSRIDSVSVVILGPDRCSRAWFPPWRPSAAHVPPPRARQAVTPAGRECISPQPLLLLLRVPRMVTFGHAVGFMHHPEVRRVWNRRERGVGSLAHGRR